MSEFMQLAIDQAWKGHGYVSPNPKVGAVLVKDGIVVAIGFHELFGGKHAEVNCLNSYPYNLDGSEILYVTLEPCSHQGKQPSCADYLIKAGLRNIVIGSSDPNPKVAGKGIEKLIAAGVNVELNCMQAECDALNVGFFKWVKSGFPYVIVKIALNSLGQIAPLPKRRTQITGELSKDYVYSLRSQVDGILVGKETVLVDDPMLAARCDNGFEPIRLILGNTDYSGMNIARDNNYRICSGDKFLEELGCLGVTSLLVEGGAKIFSYFLDNNLFDELHILLSKNGPLFEDGLQGFDELPNSLRNLSGISFEVRDLGNDKLLIWR